MKKRTILKTIPLLAMTSSLIGCSVERIDFGKVTEEQWKESFKKVNERNLTVHLETESKEGTHSPVLNFKGDIYVTSDKEKIVYADSKEKGTEYCYINSTDQQWDWIYKQDDKATTWTVYNTDTISFYSIIHALFDGFEELYSDMTYENKTYSITLLDTLAYTFTFAPYTDSAGKITKVLKTFSIKVVTATNALPSSTTITGTFSNIGSTTISDFPGKDKITPRGQVTKEGWAAGFKRLEQRGFTITNADVSGEKIAGEVIEAGTNGDKAVVIGQEDTRVFYARYNGYAIANYALEVAETGEVSYEVTYNAQSSLLTSELIVDEVEDYKDSYPGSTGRFKFEFDESTGKYVYSKGTKSIALTFNSATGYLQKVETFSDSKMVNYIAFDDYLDDYVITFPDSSIFHFPEQGTGAGAVFDTSAWNEMMNIIGAETTTFVVKDKNAGSTYYTNVDTKEIVKIKEVITDGEKETIYYYKKDTETGEWLKYDDSGKLLEKVDEATIKALSPYKARDAILKMCLDESEVIQNYYMGGGSYTIDACDLAFNYKDDSVSYRSAATLDIYTISNINNVEEIVIPE